MAFLDVKTIPHDFPRQYLPREADLGSWDRVEPFFNELQGRTLNSKADLECWLQDLWEFQDALNEEYSLRYIRMTCQTDDPQIEKQFLDFLEKVDEPGKPRFFALLKKYRDCPRCASLPQGDYFIFNRSVENELALYREENIPLETELEKLSQQYQKLSGSLTVQYEGREQTFQQMSRYLEATDRKVREEAWRLTTERRLKERDAFEDLFDQMLKLRVQTARNAGFNNFQDYMFRRKERFDYGPVECEAFHESAEKAIRPLLVKIQNRRAEKMGLYIAGPNGLLIKPEASTKPNGKTGKSSTKSRLYRYLVLSALKPWDLSVDPEGQPPLKPFDTAERLAKGCEAILGKVDAEFGNNLKTMRELDLLDLESRKGKAPGGYNSSLEEARLSFIFMNAVGLEGDVRTLLHEGGHAMHGFAARSLPFSPYRHAPIEFCEVASMSMELLAFPYLDEFFPDPKDSARYRIRQLEEVISLLPWIATVDAFQHWIYTHPDHTRQERAEFWSGLHKRLGGVEDWTGLEEIRASLWHRQLHIFEFPFYYIEYAIAQLGALQVWRNFRRDKAEAVRLYKRGLSVGGSQTLPEIFQSAGIRFDFSLGMIKPLMDEVEKELEELEKLS
jgi:oligoendopeptidase F